jgi:hypothetical protein
MDDEFMSVEPVIIDEDADSRLASQVLFDVKQCEDLFQKDKSEKMLRDIEQIRGEMMNAKLTEKEFYRNLNLSSEAKRRIFDVEAEPLAKLDKIICWDPVQGNLIMTR